MTEYSYNGWPASRDLKIRPLVVAGESFSPGVLDDDDVYEVLRYVAEQLHQRVEPIVRSDWHQADDWGFYYRPTTGGTTLSNHASATAFDYNATRHGYGVPVRENFTQAQIDEIHQILAEVDHVVRWGGDYSGTPDAMHFEINANRERVAEVARKLREGDDEMNEQDWKKLEGIVDKKVEDKLDAFLRRDLFPDDPNKSLTVREALLGQKPEVK